MASTDNKAKYAKFLRSPKWNENLFSNEGYLITHTNLDPKDERSYYHKQPLGLLSLDWAASPSEGILLGGKQEITEMVEFKHLSKGSDGKWNNDETKVKESEEKYKEHRLVSIHTTESECPMLYSLTKVLLKYKVILSLSTGVLVNSSTEFIASFKPQQFEDAVSKLVEFLLEDKDNYFDLFEDKDKVAFEYLSSIGVIANLVALRDLRIGKYTIPGLDYKTLPLWESLTYTGADAVKEAASSGGSARRSVTPKDKLESFLGLLEDTEAVSRLGKAAEGLGCTLTPQEVFSCLYGLSSGVYMPISSLAVAATPDDATAKVTSHPNWDPSLPKLKKFLLESYDVTPNQLDSLSQEEILQLIKDLDSL